MKIVLISIGTRGDVEPFIAIADLLIRDGHDVVCAFPAQFENLATRNGSRFYPLKKEFLEMLNGPTGQAALGGGKSFRERISAMFALYRMNRKVSFEMLLQQHELIQEEKPDRILHSLKAMYPVFWHQENPGKVIQVSPIPCVIHPTDNMASIFLLGKDYGKRINRWSYRFSRKLSMTFTKKQLKRAQIAATTSVDMVNSLVSEKFIYTISDSLYHRDSSWPEHVQVLGYLERDKTLDWKPSEELLGFLERNQEPLFITFGSMTNPDPVGKTQMFLDILVEKDIPAVINTAGGGLVRPEGFEHPDIFWTHDIPYDWIFPKVGAVIHHGGAGTTHLALKYGRPSMVIPHIPDQHLWNRIISNANAGPKGQSIRKLDGNGLKNHIDILLHNPAFKENAMEISHQMKSEDNSEKILRIITE